MATPSLPRTWRRHLERLPMQRILGAVALVLILAFVYTVARIPHDPLVGDGGYPLPLHMDEYLHLGKSAAVAQQGTTGFASPWFGGEPVAQGRMYHEVGFHTLLAVIHTVSGIAWVPIFTYGPALVLVLTAFGAYVLGKRHGFGHEAALFVALIPTSVRFLGPAFLTPITFAFPFLLGALAVAFHPDGRRGAAALLVLVAATWLVHARAAGFLIFPTLAAAAVHTARDRWTGALLAGAVLIPVALAMPLFFERATQTILLEERLPIQRAFFDNFGAITLVLFGIGGAFATADLLERRWRPFVLFASALFAFLFIFSRTIFQVNLFTMYSRAHMLFFVTAAPIAGYGLARILRAGVNAISSSKSLPTARLTAVFLALLAISPALAEHQDERYYHVIQPEDHETFRWMDENLDPKYQNALMYPWQALAYSAITGRTAATVQFPGDQPGPNDIALKFFRNGGQDTQLLREHHVGVVYAPYDIDNPDLKEVHERVYILLPPDAS